MTRIGSTLLLAMAFVISDRALAAPTAVNGAPFVLVATEASATQLFELAADATGRIYAGNNSNGPTGIPVQLFDPALFSGIPVVLQNFGPALGDADGIAFANGSLFVASAAGVERITAPGGVATLFMPGIATNGTGSPVVVRPSDGHIFVGLGGLTGINRIDEYDVAGAFVVSHPTGTDVETMAFDPGSGLIYYAPFSAQVRALNPSNNADVAVGTSSGTIDGGLTFDARSGLLFVGTTSGRVETIHPATGARNLFASGFNGSFGILREPLSGDLYFLEATQLYRLPSATVNGVLASGVSPVPTLSQVSLAILALLMAAIAVRTRRVT